MLKELDIQLQLLRKRIYRTLVDFGDSLGEKLWTRVKSLGRMLEKAFQVETLEDYNQAAAIYGTELAGTLYQLSGSFTGLKNAVIQAAAPLAQLLVPVVKLAADALTGLVNTVGYVFRALFQGGQAAQSYASGLSAAATAGSSLKRSLAGFDQINRLGKQSGGSGILSVPEAKPLTEAWKGLADKILELLEPLRRIDLTPLSRSLEKLRKALEPITKALFEALEWAWYNIFVPMAQWAAEELLPAFLETLAAALEALARVIEELKPAFIWLWENYLKPLAQWKADEAIRYLQGLTRELQGAGNGILSNQNIVERFILSGQTMIDTLAAIAGKYLNTSGAGLVLGQTMEELAERFLWAQTPFAGAGTALGLLSGSVLGLSDSFGFLRASSDSAWQSLQTVWGSAWSYLKEKAVEPTYQGFKTTANAMISLINGVLRGVTGGRQWHYRSPKFHSIYSAKLAACAGRQELGLSFSKAGGTPNPHAGKRCGAAGQSALFGGGGRPKAGHQYRGAPCHHSGGGGRSHGGLQQCQFGWPQRHGSRFAAAAGGCFGHPNRRRDHCRCRCPL